jgi:cleavage and polyadenylation specificity factor subunit 1
LVTKKDGSIRPCVDYTRLNAITTGDQYSLPRIEDLIHTAQGQWFSTLDLRSGYHQIPMDPDDAPKTAVTTPFGLFHFLRMPFGLKNSASTFQRFLDQVLRGLPGVVVYIDDILVFSDTEEEHIKRLRALLERLNKFGLRVHRQKCFFVQKQVKYLGYVLSGDGYEPNPDRIEAIQNFPTPSNSKELRRFLGMANFYRLHVPHFSEIASPLFAITDAFIWSDNVDAAFQKIKNALSSITLLKTPTPGTPFHVYTDASNVAAGASILQKSYPLAFYSSRFTPTEQRYSTFDREALSIIKTFHAYKHWFAGSRVILHTDHKPLLGFTKMKDPSQKQTRWIQFLSEFDISWHYEPGISNQAADCMSRIDTPTPNPTICASTILQSIGSPDWAKELANFNPQHHDENLQSLRLVRQNGHWFDISSSSTPRLFIPPKIRRECFHLVHDKAHFGFKKTYHAIATRFIWPHLRRDVHQWCAECQSCQSSKSSPVAAHSPLPFMVHDRFHTLHVDIVGPLPMSQRGSQYLVTMVDHFTRWIEAVPVSNISAESTARVILDHWVCRYGVPKCIISDQGTQFESQLFTSLLQRLGIEKHRTTTYHPQSNGTVERSHRTLKQCIRALSDAGKCWERALPLALLAMRTSISEATQFPPSQLVFGGAVSIPADFLIHSDPANLTRTVYSELLSSEIAESLHLADANQHERPRLPARDMGPWVWLKQPPQQRRSLQPLFAGPYQVIKQDGPVVTVSIQGKPTQVNVDRLKPATLPDDHDTPSHNTQPTNDPQPANSNQPPQTAPSPTSPPNQLPTPNLVEYQQQRSRYGRRVPHRFAGRPQYVFRRSQHQ